MSDPSEPLVQRRWFWSSPERSRLDGAINEALIALGPDDEKAPVQQWRHDARRHLKQARAYADARDFHQGWGSLQAAQRTIRRNTDGNKLRLEAIELRHEVSKIEGWRAEAIRNLICYPNGKLRKGLYKDPGRMRVVNALSLRDEQFQTNYFKILLRRRHLSWLFVLLVAGIVVTLWLSACDVLPKPFDDARLMAGVVLFGVLGASLSVARGLLMADLSARIPAQQIGAVVIWMRPAIGAAAALISFVLLNAKPFGAFVQNPDSPIIIFAVAIAAGFSERFIVGAIERIGDDDEKKKDKEDEKKKKAEAEA